MTYLVYMAVSPSGGAYIGITSRSLEKRQTEHRLSVKRPNGSCCKAFGNAINRYGFEGFEWSVLAEGLSAPEADHLERFLIDIYRPRYNIEAGGFLLGKIGTRGRPVICVNTGRSYSSGKTAARELGLSQMTVSGLCRKGGQTRGGLRFRFADAEEVVRKPRPPEDVAAGRASRIAKLKARRHPLEAIERMKAAAKKRGVSLKTREIGDAKKRKPIRCIQTGTILPDAYHAALAHGLARQSVYALVYSGGISAMAGVSFERVGG